MSTIYIGERQSGKTTMLIEMSEKTGAIQRVLIPAV